MLLTIGLLILTVNAQLPIREETVSPPTETFDVNGQPISTEHSCGLTSEEMCTDLGRNDSIYLSIIKEATKMAILEQLIIAEDPITGTRTYSRSCEDRVYGCEASITAIVDLFFEQKERHGIEPLILAAMAKHETNFNPFAINERTRAAGLLQLTRASGFTRGIRFIQDSNYRARCERTHDACQGEVIEASVMLLERSISRCDNNLRQGLGMYGSGSCRGSRRFVKYVMRLARHLQTRRDIFVEQLCLNYNHNYCDREVYFR